MRAPANVALGLALAGLLGCSSGGSASGSASGPHDAGPSPPGNDAAPQDAAPLDGAPVLPSQVTFPKGFLWGASTAAFQIEAHDDDTDWGVWAHMPGKIAHGDDPNDGGDDALDHIDGDIGLMTAEGHNAYRFSVEMGRLFPSPLYWSSGTPEPTALAAYDGLLAKLKAAGITPMVTLNHYALPDWLDDATNSTSPEGWEQAQTTAAFTKFCGWAAARWGSQVDWWITINEPINEVLGAYVQGSFPPGVVVDMGRAYAVARALVFAHAQCYDAIKAADTVSAGGDGTAARVSYAAHLRTFHPLDTTDPSDVAATARVKYVCNDWFLNAVSRGDFDYDLNGDLTGPNDVKGDPALKGRLDYVGVNYYSDTIVSGDHGFVIPVINASIEYTNLPTGRPRTDFGWDIYPEGMGVVLDEAAGYGLPIVVTENGVADRNDVLRGRFIAEHLLQVGAANARGDKVLGYFHWSLYDNFEWNSGYCPHFGLHSIDPVTGARTKRASADVYSSIIRAGQVTQAQIDAMPPYGAPSPCN